MLGIHKTLKRERRPYFAWWIYHWLLLISLPIVLLSFGVLRPIWPEWWIDGRIAVYQERRRSK